MEPAATPADQGPSPAVGATVEEYAPRARELCPPKSLDTYSAGFDRLIRRFGTEPLARVRLIDLVLQRDAVRREVGEAQVRRAEAVKPAGVVCDDYRVIFGWVRR